MIVKLHYVQWLVTEYENIKESRMTDLYLSNEAVRLAPCTSLISVVFDKDDKYRVQHVSIMMDIWIYIEMPIDGYSTMIGNVGNDIRNSEYTRSILLM